VKALDFGFCVFAFVLVWLLVFDRIFGKSVAVIFEEAGDSVVR